MYTERKSYLIVVLTLQILLEWHLKGVIYTLEKVVSYYSNVSEILPAYRKQVINTA